VPSQPTIDITLDGAARSIEAGTTGSSLFSRDRDVVAMKVDGAPWDLDRVIPAGASIEPITLASEDGLNILRHGFPAAQDAVDQRGLPGPRHPRDGDEARESRQEGLLLSSKGWLHGQCLLPNSM